MKRSSESIGNPEEEQEVKEYGRCSNNELYNRQDLIFMLHCLNDAADEQGYTIQS